MTTDFSSNQLVDLIRSESERFREHVSGLSADALELPTPCERWNVGEVIAHLIWFAEKYGGMVERGLRGNQSPSEGFPAVPGTMAGPAIGKFYGDSAIELRRSLGKRLIPAFCDRYDRLNDMLKAIGPDDWSKPCYHTLRIRPVESFIPVIVDELAVHEWDIRSALEPSPRLSAESLPALFANLPSKRRPWSNPFELDTTFSGRKCFRFELGGIGNKWDVIVEDGKARMEYSRGGTADLTLAGSSGTFVLLTYGRLTVDSGIASGLFTAKGNLRLIPDFDRWLAGD